MSPIIYDDIPSLPLPDAGRVLGIGVFDGVHLGHQAVIQQVLEEARRLGTRSLLFTFDRLPEEYLRPESSPRRLMSLSEKLDALAALGPDEILIAHVKPELLGRTPHEFATQIIRDLLRPSMVIVGRDFRYGKGGVGTVETLHEDASVGGFEVVAIPPVLVGEESISSTRIRGLLEAGDVEAAAHLLTRPYRLSGRVAEGKRLGRQIGFPTANLSVPPTRTVPGNGVYACRAIGESFARDAAVNIGVRPTVDDGKTVTIEAHLLEFDEEIYGQEMTLEFVQKLRDEQKFPSLDELKTQLAFDVDATRQLLAPMNQAHLESGDPLDEV